MSNEEEDWFERALREPEAEGAPEEGPSRPADFDDEIAAAFEDAPMPGKSVGGFESEEFDSSLPRIDIGIGGLDAMIQDGIPEQSLIATIGGPGTGKTTLGLEFLGHALENDERAVFIDLEGSRNEVIQTADDRGWGFSDYLSTGQLSVVDLDPVQMANSLTSIRNELPGLIQDFGASRVVMDSVSLLEMMFEDQAARRNQIFDFTLSLKNAGVSTLLTSEASEADAYHSKFGTIEYLVDAVFILQYVRTETFGETRLAIEIQKIRNANHSREMKPFELTSQGLKVYEQANIF